MRLQAYPSPPLPSLPGALAICVLRLLENRQLSSLHPCLPLSMLELLISTPGHLLNRALFSAAREGAHTARAAPRGLGCFYPKMPGCQPRVLYKLPAQWTSRKASKGAWSTAGSRLCAHP